MPKSLIPKSSLPSGWKIEAVTERMRGSCFGCGGACKSFRFVHTQQTIPFPTTHRYCTKCAIDHMRQFVAAMSKAVDNCEKALKELIK